MWGVDSYIYVDNGANLSPYTSLPMANTYSHIFAEDTKDTTYLTCYPVNKSKVVITSVSFHADKERYNRLMAMELLMPKGCVKCAFKVQRACDYEEVYHIVYESGRVDIVSLKGELITAYHCESYAIRRYYKGRQKTNFYDSLQKVCDKNYKTYEEFCRFADTYKGRTEQFITDIVSNKVTIK